MHTSNEPKYAERKEFELILNSLCDKLQMWNRQVWRLIERGEERGRGPKEGTTYHGYFISSFMETCPSGDPLEFNFG